MIKVTKPTKMSDVDFNEILEGIYEEGKKGCVSPQESKEHNDRIECHKRQQCWTEAYKNANLPHIKYDASLGNDELLKFVNKNKKYSLCLVSKKSGVCKTRTMIHVAESYFLLLGLPLKFFTAAQLARDIAASHFKDKNMIKELCKVKLLIIDDIGKEKLTERASADIFEILDYRYLHEKPTWLSTNFLGNELSEIFGIRGEYLVRRIKETYKIYAE